MVRSTQHHFKLEDAEEQVDHLLGSETNANPFRLELAAPCSRLHWYGPALQ